LILQGDGANPSYYDNNISGEHALQASQSTTGPNKISPIAVDSYLLLLLTLRQLMPILLPCNRLLVGLSKEEMDKIIAQHLAVGLPPPDASFLPSPFGSRQCGA
jgi:hypothetical protein